MSELPWQFYQHDFLHAPGNLDEDWQFVTQRSGEKVTGYGIATSYWWQICSIQLPDNLSEESRRDTEADMIAIAALPQVWQTLVAVLHQLSTDNDLQYTPGAQKYAELELMVRQTLGVMRGIEPTKLEVSVDPKPTVRTYPLNNGRIPIRFVCGACQCPATGSSVTAYLDEETGLMDFEIDDPEEDSETQAWCDRAKRKVRNSEQALEHLKRLGFQPEEIKLEAINS